MKKLVLLLLAFALAIMAGCGGSNTVLGPPTGVTATAGNTSVTVAWSPEIGAMAYNVYYSSTSGGAITGGKFVATQANSATITGLTNGTTYYFAVTALNQHGESAAYAQVSATPLPPVPSAPTGVTATAGVRQVSLAWTALSTATSYNVYYSTSASVSTTTGTKVPVTTNSATVTGLTAGTIYYFIVTAVNLGGESTASTLTTSTPLSPVAPPINLAAAGSDGAVQLTYNSGQSGVTAFNIYFSTSSSVTTATGTKYSTTGTSATITGLTNGTKYYFIATEMVGTNESTATAAVSATPLAALLPPSNITATPGDTQLAVSWTGVTGAISYNLYYSTSAGVTTSNGTKVGGLTSTSYTITGLTDGTPYYVILTTVNANGTEGLASTAVTGTPGNGAMLNLVPGTTPSATLNYDANTALTFTAPSTTTSQNATANILPMQQSALPTPLIRANMKNGRFAPQVTASDTFIAAFQINVNPSSITQFNVPIALGGHVSSSIFSAGIGINLARLENNVWVDVATAVVGTGGTFNENLPSVSLPGILGPGLYLLYKPAKGSNTTVSNLGVVLLGDDGMGMADGSHGLQVIHLYDSTGALLSTPAISYLDYSNASDLDGQAMTPDGSQGIMVDGGNTVRFFSAVQTGVPVASTYTLNTSSWGSDGDSIAIFPNGDEAVVSGDSNSQIMLVTGILSGSPVVSQVIPVPNDRDGLVMNTSGTALLARGYDGVTVFKVNSITPTAGAIAGTVSHSFTQINNYSNLGTGYYTEDGRDGMAFSPVDDSRAVVVMPSVNQMMLITGLPDNPVVSTPISLDFEPYAVSISPDGKLAVVGGQTGIVVVSGVDTGNLAEVGTVQTPSYSVGTSTVNLGLVYTLGITLDGKYVVAGDYNNKSLVIIPFSATGIGTPITSLGGVAIPYNDQMLIH